jgi:hypothetical protein
METIPENAMSSLYLHQKGNDRLAALAGFKHGKSLVCELGKLAVCKRKRELHRFSSPRYPL